MAVKAHCMAVARDPTTGAALLSATVNVYTPGTVTPIPATIYDKSGGVLSNPLTSDAATGLIDFYLTIAQEVDLSVAKTGYTTRTYSNVPVLDDATFELSSLLTATGDLVYASAPNSPVRLPVGTNNQLLQVAGGIPSWTSTPTIPYASLTAVAFTTFTPTLNQNGVITTSAAVGRYIQLGKLVIGMISLTSSGIGTTSNVITAGGLPVAAQANWGVVGSATYNRSGGPYGLIAELATTTSLQFRLGSQNASPLGVTPAFAIANADVLIAFFAYEAA